MKRTVNYQRAVQYLNKIYKAVNEYYFNNELEPVTITIQSTVTAYGHCSVSKVWTDTDGNKTRELNIAAEYMSRPIENVVATMIHEASHIYNLQNGIKDTSGYYHNKRFKKTAEEMGHLQIDHDSKYGWTVTSPTDDTLEFCIMYGFDDILTSRDTGLPIATGTATPKTGNGNGTPTRIKKPSNSKRYQCPICKAIVRATSTVNIICGDCNVPFELTNK